MPSSPAAPQASRNLLLALLPANESTRFFSHLEPVSLRLRQVVCEAGQPTKDVYFPETAMLSVISEDSDGSSAEVGMIGREGMAGTAVLLGGAPLPFTTIAQVEGEAQRISAPALLTELRANPTLNSLLQRYAHFFMAQIGQTAACNGLHSNEQRCARWLLTTADGVGLNEFTLTHEFLSQMLAVRRATVTEVAGTLQKKGLLRYHRGRVTILDRKRLVAFCCPCYQLLRTHLDGLLGRSSLDMRELPQRPAK